MQETIDSPESILCTACGLCCTGHLFIWAKLKPSELDPAEALGMQVFRADPNERGFSQPCPLWRGLCTIHESQHYPRACRAYKCKLLKSLQAGTIDLPAALETVEQAKAHIRAAEPLLPPSPVRNFRLRLVAEIEQPLADHWTDETYSAFRAQADALVAFCAAHFGVTDMVENKHTPE